MITDPDKIPPGNYKALYEPIRTIQDQMRGHGKIWAYQNEETLDLISPDCGDVLETVEEMDFQI